MIIDANEIETGTSIRCDLCIIGAGAAGITLAREFDGSGLNIWLLESGGFEREPDIQAMYKGSSIGRPYYALDVTRLRYLGGTTNHWSGICRPLDEIDFKKRDWVRYSGWPFNREHLVPWYRRAQTVCQLDEFSYDADDWLPDNQKPSPFKTENIITKVYQHSPPTRFGRVYRSQIKKSRNITVCLHANLTRLQADTPPAYLKHLSVTTLQGKTFNIKPLISVLACGSLENARLLLTSNDVETNGLGNQHDLVGRFFMDHLSLPNNGAMLTTTHHLSDFWYQIRYRARRKLPVPALLLSDALQEKNATSNYNVILRPPKRIAGVNSYRYLENSIKRDKEITNFWRHVGNIFSDIDDVGSMLYYRNTENLPIEPLLSQQWEQVPNPDSRITLSTGRDRLGLQRIQLDWRLSDIDKRTAITAQLALAREIGNLGLGRLRIDTGTEEAVVKAATGDHHQLGTTRMHESPELGVVDPDCRLHSTHNLYIAGGSVFPTIGCTNPTLTVVALALRLADHLKEKLS